GRTMPTFSFWLCALTMPGNPSVATEAASAWLNWRRFILPPPEGLNRYCYIGLQSPVMTTGPARGPRPSSIARVDGIDYVDLEQHLGYALRRAQVAAFDAFHRATAGASITPPRFTALVILKANPGITQSTLGEVLGTARSGAM